MGRSPRFSKENLDRGAWTTEEDRVLREYVQVHGEGRWNWVLDKAGLNRGGKSCRLRWMNYLRPNIKRGNISSDEDDLIIRLHRLLGNRWSLIDGRLPGRTDNEIKNYWNSHLKKEIGTIIGRERIESKIAVEDRHNLLQEQQMYENENNTSPATVAGHQIIRPTAVQCSKNIVIDPETNNDIQPFDEKWTTLFNFDSIAKDFSQNEALLTVDHSNSPTYSEICSHHSMFSLSEEMEILLRLKHDGNN